MEKFNGKYRIKSARAPWHNYNDGSYFVTICTKNMQHYFGEIVLNKNNGPQMKLSEIGKCVDECMHAVHDHFPHVDVPLFVVMPNHVHAIIINPIKMEHVSQHNQFGPQSKNLASVVRGMKIAVTKYAHQNNIDFAWQSRYHDHIIRNQNEMDRIAQYINNNITKWCCRYAKFCVSTTQNNSTPPESFNVINWNLNIKT